MVHDIPFDICYEIVGWFDIKELRLVYLLNRTFYNITLQHLTICGEGTTHTQHPLVQLSSLGCSGVMDEILKRNQGVLPDSMFENHNIKSLYPAKKDKNMHMMLRSMLLFDDRLDNQPAQWFLIVQNEIERGNLQGVKYILQKESLRHLISTRSFRRACKFGYIEVVEELLSNNIIEKAAIDDGLLYAAEENHIEIVNLLLTHGADPSIQHNQAFRSACRQGNYELVKLLLLEDVRINPCDIDFAAISYIVYNDDTRMMELLLRDPRMDLVRNKTELLRIAEQNPKMISLIEQFCTN
ncbi:ankyrin repeat-containing protein [Acrasis kona]|uniref:Ankyrin repeat-containing protein n=1 Tax=Acrasis kona TaxID=1008807 RepID=A0AAW2ZLB2_9EUKA